MKTPVQQRVILKTSGMNIRNVKVVDITDLIPAEWDWFWGMLNSSNPDFSFGDNNLTLIHPERFALFIDDSFEWFSSDEDVVTCSSDEWQEFMDKLGSLTQAEVYINLEA
jgi:hypothetical protein